MAAMRCDVEEAIIDSAVRSDEVNRRDRCVICHHEQLNSESFKIRSNTRRFRNETFEVRRCNCCSSIHCQAVGDISAYYEGYGQCRQNLNPVTRSWYSVLLNRLRKVGFDESWSILDYGCGNGLFLKYLAQHGFRKCKGYDPYVEEFRDTQTLDDAFDLVFTQDVIEHDDHPSEFMATMSRLTRSGGYVSIGTPNADGINLARAEQEEEEDIHHVHVPFHRHILSRRALIDLAGACNLSPVAIHHRWFRDHWLPGANRRFIFELIRRQGNDIDAAFDPVSLRLFLRYPKLVFYLFFGYFLANQKRDNIHVIFRRD